MAVDTIWGCYHVEAISVFLKHGLQTVEMFPVDVSLSLVAEAEEVSVEMMKIVFQISHFGC